MANSKRIHIRHKHRRRVAAAKEKMQMYLGGKLQEEALPVLARHFLEQRLRVVKRG